ncbi:D-alanyl-D-alanine carboxypeptidase family protein [Streptomyces erythrochromogenes]|uniref:D-alanyl-D-alanine carboxypeptidase family protein n=1 Tax=Streptomyces erythrochromogenes TaxID=285574 RepID=UPI003822F6AF
MGTLGLLSRFVTPAQASRTQFRRAPDGMSALAWMLSDAETGDVLASRQPHRRLAPASTLKTLFAIVVMPRLEGSDSYTVTASDLNSVPTGSSVVGLERGAEYSIDDLWRGVFLRSGNDAVRVLAHLNGGWNRTAAQMEQYAIALGAEDTTVVSPDGFDAPGQFSTVHDLTVFARVGLSRTDFLQHCRTKRALFPNRQSEDGYVTITNTNRLLSGANGVPPYPGILGVKNGYTSRAGNTLIAAAHRQGRTLLATVMNPQSGKPNAVYEEARALLDWGFELPDDTEAESRLPDLPAGSQLDPALKDKAMKLRADRLCQAVSGEVGT